jgi:hypothetical protein
MQEIHGECESNVVLYPVSVSDLVSCQPLEIFVDDETKLTLHGLQQHYVKLEEVGKNRKLNELLDTLEFNQASLICLPNHDLLSYSCCWLTGRYLRQISCSCNRA